uniref:C2H2-type domain-containing protein n=1 Tax=Meleagris gallopavo TaxID=9103 RepID=A0A803YLM5_MELGA
MPCTAGRKQLQQAWNEGCGECFFCYPVRKGSGAGTVFSSIISTEGMSPIGDTASLPESVKVKEERPMASHEASAPSLGPEGQKCPGEQAKPKSKKKPSRYASNSLLMGDCRRGYVREWSHPCTECGKRFRLKINLIIHQRSHAKEGPYECTMCEISFTDKKRLVLHQGIHTQERAFAAKQPKAELVISQLGRHPQAAPVPIQELAHPLLWWERSPACCETRK